MNSSNIRHVISYLVLAILLLLVYQFLITVSDPTKRAIKRSQDSIQIDEAYLIDTTLSLNLKDIIAKDADFIRQGMDEIPWGFGKQAYWIRLTLDNNNDQTLNLVTHFSNPMLEQLNIYQISAEATLKESALGWQEQDLSKKARSLPSFEFTLAAKTRQQLFIRIATEGISKTPIHIYSKDDFSKLVGLSYLIWGAFVGILIAMSLYNLVLFWGLKDVIYLVYIGYIISLLMMLGIVIGFGHYIWPETLLRYFREAIVAINTLVIIFSVSFAILFFNSLRNKTRILKLNIFYVIYLIVFSIISLLLPENTGAPIFFVSLAFLYPLVFLLILQQAKDNIRWTWLYLVSWAPLLVGGVLQPMELTGVIESSFLVHHAFMIGVLLEIILMAMALAERMQYKKARALYKATHDPETKLANINLLEARAETLRLNKIDFAIAVVEIENFSTLLPYISNADNNDLTVMLAKNIERQLHYAGNIIELGCKNKSAFKIAKINEGTFAFIIKITSTADAEKERINKQLTLLTADMKNNVHIGKLLINLSINIGISLTEPQYGISFSDLLKQAYRALEQGKNKGLSYSFYQHEQALNVAQKLTLAADLQQALRANKLQLFHQPQINLATKKVDGSEALLRWQHDEKGFIAPDTFINLAEDTGIINELTLWVIDTACRQLEELQKLGYNEHNVSVNISGKDITEDNFLDNVRSIIEKYDITLSCLTFELTESVMVTDLLNLSQTMQQLTELGIQVAIDDYGTGYSSLFYISKLPFTELKIDKSFVMNLEHSETDLTIVKTTIEMAKSLGLKIVAEGIENKAVEEILKTHYCDLVQGYYYKKPTEFNEYLTWLDTQPK